MKYAANAATASSSHDPAVLVGVQAPAATLAMSCGAPSTRRARSTAATGGRAAPSGSVAVGDGERGVQEGPGDLREPLRVVAQPLHRAADELLAG